MIRVKTLPLAIIVVTTIFAGIFTAKTVGYYETTSSKEPAKFSTGELAGLPNPADIRGSYTWEDIEKAFGVPAVAAAAAFSTPERTLEITERVNTLEAIYAGKLPEGMEIGTGAVRLFVSLYTGLPMEAEEGSVLPDAVLLLLAGRPDADIEALEVFRIPGTTIPAEAMTTPGSTQPPVAAETVPTAVPASATVAEPSPSTSTETVHGTSTGTATSAGTGTGTGTGAAASSSGKTVVGKTTFGNLYDWGLTEAQVEEVLGYKPGPKAQSVRDSAIANGREFSEFKAELQGLLDKTNP